MWSNYYDHEEAAGELAGEAADAVADKVIEKGTKLFIHGIKLIATSRGIIVCRHFLYG